MTFLMAVEESSSAELISLRVSMMTAMGLRGATRAWRCFACIGWRMSKGHGPTESLSASLIKSSLRRRPWALSLTKRSAPVVRGGSGWGGGEEVLQEPGFRTSRQAEIVRDAHKPCGRGFHDHDAPMCG